MSEKNDKHSLPNPENPEKLSDGKISKAKTVAAGMQGVLAAAGHVFSEMNPVRGIQALLKLNQKDGYDCPGCAWPDPDDDRSVIAEYCENGAKAIAEEATTKKLDPGFFKRHSVSSLSLLNDYEIGKKGRITHPMYLAEGADHYEEISWDDAFEKMADKLNSLSSPDEAIFYTSGRTSNEAAFLYQLFVREFGTNNLPDCSNMCHESSGVAMTESLGIGKGSVKLEDFYEAELIIILGQNPGTNHPRMLSALQKAKDNGAKIIAINPLPETGLISFNDPQTVKGILGIKSKLSDLFLQVKINGDMALLKAINLLLAKEENKSPGSVFDRDFIHDHTNNSEAYLKDLNKYSPEELSQNCGISLEQIREAAELIRTRKKIIACWAMGLTQHKNAVDTIKEVVNLLLLKGSIGKPGSGTCPVRGHSNVQGDRTMGIYEKPSAEFLNSLNSVFGIEAPRKNGYDTVESIHAMHEGNATVFFAMGGNFLSATPDTLHTAEALQRCDLTVHVSTKLNRSHLIHGKEALILPTYGRSDTDLWNGENQFITCENSMGVVQLSKGTLKPVSTHFLSEPVIVCMLAKSVLGNKSKVNWDLYLKHYDHIRDAIEKTISGFEKYNERVRIPGGFYLPNSSRERNFDTLSGKAELNIADVSKHILENDELLMMTIRSHDQFNTTIYGMNDRYRGIYNERRVIFMNEKDIKSRGLIANEVVDLVSDKDGTRRVAHKFLVVPFSIPEKCCATYFPETNVLVPLSSVADKSNTPVSKSVIIRVEKNVA